MTTRYAAGILAIVGGLLIVVGCFMPWGQFASFLNVYSATGISLGSGVIAAVAGAAVLVCGALALQGHDRAARLTAIPGVIALLAAGWVAISWQLGIGLPEGPGWTGLTSHGVGLVVVAIGAVLGVASSLLSIARGSRQSGS